MLLNEVKNTPSWLYEVRWPYGNELLMVSFGKVPPISINHISYLSMKGGVLLRSH